jgi:ABC-type phosphate/phosphonate transport system substrate-binding protein
MGRHIVQTTKRIWPAFVLLGICWVQAGRTSFAGERSSQAVPKIQVKVVESFCRDMPRQLVEAMTPPFRALMKSLTGIDSDVTFGGTGFDVGRELVEGKIQIGMLQGIEFAWTRQKYPDLRPLAIVINQKTHLRAFLVVAEKGQVAQFPDLKGQALAMPLFLHEHCHLFLDRLCREQQQEAKHFFSKVTHPSCAEAALDDVAEGLVKAAIIQEVSLDSYKRRKPGRWQQLKVLRQSEVFPASVVVYSARNLNKDTTKKLRDGMLKANKDPVGRHLLSFWKMTSFEPVPADYGQTLDEIIKVYPPPAEDPTQFSKR